MKQKVSRRHFLSGTAGVIIGTVVAACAPPTPKPVPTSAPAATAAQPTAVPTVAKPTAAPVSGKKVTVQFLNRWGAAREQLMNEAIKSFHQENPGIEVINDLQPADNWDQRTATAIASGKPPAVIMVLTPQMALFAHQSLIVPINPYVEKRGLKLYDVFYPGDIDAMRWGNNYYSMPLPSASGRNDIYLYNKVAFSQEGLDPDKPPKTWEELEKAAKATTVLERVGLKVIGAQVVVQDTPSPAEPGANFTNWLYCNNGAFISDDAKKLTFNSPEGVETLEWMIRFTNEINGSYENVIAFLTGALLTADYPFFKDRLAMWFTGDWAFLHLENFAKETFNNPEAWGVALRPYNGRNPAAGSHGNSGPGAWANVIAKGVPQEVQDAAYLWVEFMGMHPQGGCKFLYAQKRPSPAKKCNDFYPYRESNPYWDVVVKAKQQNKPLPITPAHSEIAALLSTAVEQALRGQKKSKEALDWAAAQGQAVLDRFWGKS